MRIKDIRYAVRKDKVYDIETPSHSYLLWNGIISHNTMEMYSKAVMSGGCVLAGTEIQMADGTTKKVEDIFEGDFVKTLLGDKEVSYTWDPDTLEDGEPECYEIEFDDGYTITCSDKHKFLLENMTWIEAKDIKEGINVISNT